MSNKFNMSFIRVNAVPIIYYRNTILSLMERPEVEDADSISFLYTITPPPLHPSHPDIYSD